LHAAATWLCEGLTKRVPGATTRRSVHAPGLSCLTDQLKRAPTDADRLRLLNRHQRSVLARVDRMLLEPVDIDLRAFLQEAHVRLSRSVGRCDDAIAELDREREVRHPGGTASERPS
jgi:hypothetical protein